MAELALMSEIVGRVVLHEHFGAGLRGASSSAGASMHVSDACPLLLPCAIALAWAWPVSGQLNIMFGASARGGRGGGAAGTGLPPQPSVPEAALGTIVEATAEAALGTIVAATEPERVAVDADGPGQVTLFVFVLWQACA